MRYGYDITYTELFHGRTTCGVMGHEDLEMAMVEATQLALSDGWTQPRWWQWWRWGDTRVPDE